MIHQITATAEETSNILDNGSFDNQTEGWETSGNVDYDSNNYGDINKSVRFSTAEGGSISQDINLSVIAEDKIIDSVDGSFTSIGCNNIDNDWCSKIGTIDNLDTIDWELKFQDATQLEILNFNLTSDYNDGAIKQTFSSTLSKEFNTDTTNLQVIVSGADTGDWKGQFGSILDNLSLVLTLSDPIIPEIIETPILDNIEPSSDILENNNTDILPNIVEIPEIDVINDINTGIIEMPELETNIDIINDSLVIEDIQIDLTNEVPIIDESIDITEPEIDMPDIDMPELDIEELPTEEIAENELKDVDEIVETESIEAQEEINEKKDNLEVTDKTLTNKEDNIKEEKQSINETKSDDIEKEKPEIQSDIVVQELDLPQIISFDKEYFAKTYKDTIDLTSTEVAFYGKDGFDSNDYTQVNTDFFTQYSNTDSQWDMVVKPNVIKIDSFRR